MRTSIIGIFAPVGIAGCLDRKNENNLDQQAPQTQEESFRSRLLEIAQTYKTYGRYSERSREGPVVCAVYRG
jgi:hypothetical protein